MKLTHLRIARLGPFYFNHELEIDPSVTILTGSNDAGKSSTLRLLQLFLEGKNVDEMMVNQEFLRESQTKWMEDSTPRVEMQLQIDSEYEVEPPWSTNYRTGDVALVGRAMTIEGSKYEHKARSATVGDRNWRARLPALVFPSGATSIRENIDLSTPNQCHPVLAVVGDCKC